MTTRDSDRHSAIMAMSRRYERLTGMPLVVSHVNAWYTLRDGTVVTADGVVSRLATAALDALESVVGTGCTGDMTATD